MLKRKRNYLPGGVVLAGIMAMAGSADALTIDVDGVNYTTLSAAVTAAYASDLDGPDIINLAVNSLPTADGQILLDKPITINGDGETSGAGDGTQCDILVDMTGIQAAAAVGDPGKAYIEIVAVGDVNISDLKIHPNADGAFETGANEAQIVSGFRMVKPVNSTDVGNYTLTNVYVSGSDGNNSDAFVSPASGLDLYNQAGIKKWGGRSDGGDGAFGSHAAFQLTNGGGAGIYNTTLDHCHGGLSYGAGLNIPMTGGVQNVFGGVYGHCARDGIRVSGTSVTLQGTQNDRLRVVRSTNVPAGNSHGVEVASGGQIELMEYVDVASVNTANNFVFRSNGAHVKVMRFCRAMGKFDAGANSTVYMADKARVDLVEACTFVGGGSNFNPFQTKAGGSTQFDGSIHFKDSIFTSEDLGFLVYDNNNNQDGSNDAGGTVTITNCALPIDGLAGESLRTTAPISGNAAASLVPVNPVNSSPNFLLTLADYDWSNDQGALDPLNGAGNHNVLRPAPTSTDYLTGASGGTMLTGGAGPLLSGIDPAEWMLME